MGSDAEEMLFCSHLLLLLLLLLTDSSASMSILSALEDPVDFFLPSRLLGFVVALSTPAGFEDVAVAVAVFFLRRGALTVSRETWPPGEMGCERVRGAILRGG